MQDPIPELNEYLATEVVEQTESFVGKCPPPPNVSAISPDSQSAYNFLRVPENGPYGLTALMVVQEFNDPYYGVLGTGTIILYPGIANTAPPPYGGSFQFKGANAIPLSFKDSSTALHAQLIAKFPTAQRENFIGFSIGSYDWPSSLGWNSLTCNLYWFGQRGIPAECDGFAWQQAIIDNLKANLQVSE